MALEQGQRVAIGTLMEIKKRALRVGSDPACGDKTCETGFERVSVKAVPEPLSADGGVGESEA